MLHQLKGYLFGSTDSLSPVNQNQASHPLFLAVQAGDLFELSRLLNLSINVDMKDGDENTPLILATANNNLAAMRLLLNAGASLDVRGNNGYTALNVAAFTGHCEAAALLISWGANLEVRAQQVSGNFDGGRTPLWTAVIQANEDMVRLLIAAGADVNVKDRHGNSMFYHAVTFGHYNIIGLLMQGGARFNERSPQGKLPIEEAQMRGRFDIVNLLRSDEFTVRNMDFSSQQPIERVMEPALPPLPPSPEPEHVEVSEGSQILTPASLGEEVDDNDLELPDWCNCPVSGVPMKDPISLHNGQTYERSSLIQWSATKGNNDTFPCPKTRDAIPIAALTTATNINLRDAIESEIQRARAAKRAEIAEAKRAAEELKRKVEEPSSPGGEMRRRRLQFFTTAQQGGDAANNSENPALAVTRPR